MPGCLAATAQSCETGKCGWPRLGMAGLFRRDIFWGEFQSRCRGLELLLGTVLGEAAAEP